ncbi:50S ribosomal protein L4 [candidate division WWE3 bacterium]|nr:50S ribosomal protein L4 [candidate division WWE3 bacterium]
MQAKQYDINGKEIGHVELSSVLFEQEFNPELIAQYIHVHRQRKALGTKKTKSRGEVAGGGHKPWRQKGTGRARHGSIRSPLWVGGGHAHPISPTSDVRIRVSKPMRQKALRSALSLLAKDERIISLHDVQIDNPKTKVVVDILKKLSIQDLQVLFVVPQKNEQLVKSVRNLPNVAITEARLLNPVVLLNADKVVMVNDVLPVIEEVFNRAK